MKDCRISHVSQLCDVVSYTRDGREKGRYLDVYNGKITFTICLDKCMDISYFRYRGENISFISSCGINTDGDFDHTFCGGMLYTCGLESLGNRQGFPMHGSLHNTKAALQSVTCNEKEICIVGFVRDARLFGGNVVLERKIYTTYMSGRVEISDTLRNEGYTDVNYALLYHINFGFPFLTEGATVNFQSEQSRGRDDFAKQNIAECKLICAPTDFREQVFFHKVPKGCVQVKNSEQNRVATVSYSAEALPCLIQWKSMVAGNYALGVEPSTCFLDEEFAYKTLKSQDNKKFSVSIDVVDVE